MMIRFLCVFLDVSYISVFVERKIDSGLEMGWVHNIHNVYNKGSFLKINIVTN